MTGGPEPQRLTVPWLLVLHLTPGIVFTAILTVVSRAFVRHGLTAYLAEILLIPACLAPMLLGIILLWSARADRGLSLVRPLAYREPGSVLDYTVLPLVLFLCGALCSLLVAPATTFLEDLVRPWFPQQLTSEAMLGGIASAAPGARRAALLAAALFSGVMAPLVEEAYFRGFLLPRMRHLGRLAPVLSAFLFGLYHFFAPWNLPAIFVAFLPVAFVVQAKRNFRIGVVMHAMLNLNGVLILTLRYW